MDWAEAARERPQEVEDEDEEDDDEYEAALNEALKQQTKLAAWDPRSQEAAAASGSGDAASADESWRDEAVAAAEKAAKAERDRAEAEEAAGEYEAHDAASRKRADEAARTRAEKRRAGEKAGSWESREDYVKPGHEGFNAFAQRMMRESSVPSNDRVKPPSELAPAMWAEGRDGTRPRLQPYQETVSFLCRPLSYPNPRMLVCHRTGAGKTATILQVADNFFLDRRPKILLFPTQAVSKNFYRELRNPRFPNRYAQYLDMLDSGPSASTFEAKPALELKGILRRGVVRADYRAHPRLPSAPLRAFTYTMAGGRSSIGDNPK